MKPGWMKLYFHWKLTFSTTRSLRVWKHLWSFQALQVSFCPCVLESNLLLAGLFIEGADPSKPSLKKSQVATHASSTEPNAISFWEMDRFRMQWTMKLVRGTSGAERQQAVHPSKPLTSYSVKSVKQWSVPESQCISKLTLFEERKADQFLCLL